MRSAGLFAESGFGGTAELQNETLTIRHGFRLPVLELGEADSEEMKEFLQHGEMRGCSGSSLAVDDKGTLRVQELLER